jgi:uncharacterized membrane protein YfcA
VSLPFLAALLALGAATGFAAGLLGIGGGMLLVPFLTMMLAARGYSTDVVVHMAVATSLATILFTSISSVRAHHARGAVLWPVVKTLAPGVLLGSLIGAQIAGLMSTFWIALFFAVFVGFSATQMLLDRKPAPHRDLPRPAGMFGAGTAIGAVSSVVGAGGGFITVPFLVWCNVRMHSAVATSAAMGFPIAAAGTVGYIVAGLRESGLPHCSAASFPMCAVGYIYVPALLACAAASVLMAPLGARTAHALNVGPLRRLFALLLYALAGYMLWKAWRSL